MEITSLLLLLSFLMLMVLIFTNYVRKLIYWRQQNVDTFSVIKTYRDAKKIHLSLILAELYQKMYSEQKPLKVAVSVPMATVVVQDLQAIKDIMVTQFKCFSDRGSFVNPRDPLSCSLVTMTYEMWKPTRQKFTPAFSPAKIKMMFSTLSKVGEHFVDVIKENIESGVDVMNVDDLSARFTTDVIGNVAFGVECNSLKDPNTEFRVYGDQAVDFNIDPSLHILGGKYPKLFNMLNVKTFKKEITEFFTRVVRETIEYRETHNIRRNDFMDVLIELKNDDTGCDDFSLTLDMIVAQVFVFFVAGFGTSSSTITYALYELAKNEETQKKARESVQDIITKNDNQITYDSLQDMLYLQLVIQETLRMYPVVPNVRRMCRRPCKLMTTTGPIRVPSGTFIMIPVYGIHYNPEFYPQPERFRPERFADGELTKRPASSYMPFGIGPRACVGLRFAKMQVAFTLALLLTHFRFSICEKTPKDLVFNPKNPVFLTVKGGIYLKVEGL